MPYHVFIERPRETSALAVARIAGAIASRYGLPSEAIAERMAQGRFRVKANVDLDGARRVAADLESLGAVCTIEDAATGARVTAPIGTNPSSPPPVPVAKPALPPPKPVPPLPPSSGGGLGVGSALSAAAAGSSEQDLGALGGGDFAVSALDGNDEPVRKPAAAFTPPPPARSTDKGKQPVGEGPPADLFAPPESHEEVELAVDVLPAQKIAAPPKAPPTPAPAPQGGGDQRAAARMSAPVVAAAAPDLREALDQRPLVRFAVGVALALLAGLAPAWLFASVREGSAYDAPRAAIERADQDYSQARPATAEEAQALTAHLDRMRADQRGLMESAQSGIALFAALIWLGVAGAVGFVWVRRVGW